MTDDYATLFRNLPPLQLASILPFFLLTLMRIGPIVVIAPFFGAKLLPMPVRAGLMLCLSVVLFPNVLFNASGPLDLSVSFIAFALKELLIGFVMGFFVSIPFFIVQSSGVLIDFQRGSSALQSTDPTIANQSSPIGILYNYILIVLFFQIDGPFHFLDAVQQSYQVIPADHWLNPTFFTTNLPFWKKTAGLLTEITSISMQLAAPPLVAILMADMFLGITNRLAPQVQIAFLGMSIKSLLGLVLLWAGWFFILTQLGKVTTGWLNFVDLIVDSMKRVAQ